MLGKKKENSETVCGAGLSLQCGRDSFSQLVSSLVLQKNKQGELTKKRKTHSSSSGEEEHGCVGVVTPVGQKDRDDGDPGNWTLGMRHVDGDSFSQKGDVAESVTQVADWRKGDASLSLGRDLSHPKLSIGLILHSEDNRETFCLNTNGESIVLPVNGTSDGVRDCHEEGTKDRVFATELEVKHIECADFWTRATEREEKGKGRIEESSIVPHSTQELAVNGSDLPDRLGNMDCHVWQNLSSRNGSGREVCKKESSSPVQSFSKTDIKRSFPDKHHNGQKLVDSEERAGDSEEGGDPSRGCEVKGSQTGLVPPSEPEPGSCSPKKVNSRGKFLTDDQWENLKALAAGEYEKKKGRPHVVKGALHYGDFLEECVEWVPGVWLSASVLLCAYRRWVQNHPPSLGGASIKNLQQQAMILGPLGLDLKKKHFHCGSRLRTVGMNYRGITLRPSALALAGSALPSSSLLSGAVEAETDDTEIYADDDTYTVDDDGMSEVPSTERSGRSQGTREEMDKVTTEGGDDTDRSFAGGDSRSEGGKLLKKQRETGRSSYKRNSEGVGTSLRQDVWENTRQQSCGPINGVDENSLTSIPQNERMAEATEASCVPGDNNSPRKRRAIGEEEVEGRLGGEASSTGHPRRAFSSSVMRQPSSKDHGLVAPVKVEGLSVPSTQGGEGIPSCLRRILKAVGCKSVPEISSTEGSLGHREDTGVSNTVNTVETNNEGDEGNRPANAIPESSVGSPTKYDNSGEEEEGGSRFERRGGGEPSESLYGESRESVGFKPSKPMRRGSDMAPPFSGAPRGVGKGAVVRLPGSLQGPIGEQIGRSDGQQIRGMSLAGSLMGNLGTNQKPPSGPLGKGKPPGNTAGNVNGTGNSKLVRPAATRLAAVGCGSEDGRSDRW